MADFQQLATDELYRADIILQGWRRLLQIAPLFVFYDYCTVLKLKITYLEIQ